MQYMREDGTSAACAALPVASELFSRVSAVYTLGPVGTNCERAAIDWARERCPSAEICLEPSMEEAARAVAIGDCSVLLSVVAYPELHTIMYTHLATLRLVDMFIMNTNEMVLASATGAPPQVCATHPAPQTLLPAGVMRRMVASNIAAARECAEGRADSCITTADAAAAQGLQVLRTFGHIPMGFTIHAPYSMTCAAAVRSVDLSSCGISSS